MKSSVYWAMMCSLAVCAAADSHAQDTPEITSQQTPVTFTSRVNLVSVPVVVRDSKGHAIGNLRPENFRLFDKGKAQVITKFTVSCRGGSSGTAASALVPGTGSASHGDVASIFVAYIFDDIHMNFGQLTQVRTALARHFAESLGPPRRAAIATTSGRVWLDFTADRDKLLETLRRIIPGPNAAAASNAEGLGRHDSCPPNVSYYQADQALNYQNPDEIRAAEAAAVACFGPDPGPPALGLSVAAKALSAGNMNTKSTFGSLADLIRRLSTIPGSRSIVLVSSGFFVTREFDQTEAALVDAAIRANITVNGLDARGVFTANSAEANAEGDAMRSLTDGTGGTFFEHDNGFQVGFHQLATPPEYTYVLGFAPQNLKLDGSYHRLKVALVHPKGLELEARPGYWAPDHAVDAIEQARAEIREAVFSLDEVRDIPVDVSTEFFKTSAVAAELTVESHLDVNGLKFRTVGSRRDDTLTLVTGLFDQDGHFLKGIQKIIDLRLRTQTLNQLLGSGIADKETFDVAPGRYVVRVVVRDSEGQEMTARNGTVNIQ